MQLAVGGLRPSSLELPDPSDPGYAAAVEALGLYGLRERSGSTHRELLLSTWPETGSPLRVAEAGPATALGTKRTRQTTRCNYSIAHSELLRLGGKLIERFVALHFLSEFEAV